MSSLIILVGIPGCGKSTWAGNIFPHHVVVSSDAIREELSHATDQSRNNDVFEIFHERIAKHLNAGRSVVADSTALDAFARAKLRLVAWNADASTHLIHFSNIEEGMIRNAKRPRVVPDDVMIRMIRKYVQFKIDVRNELYDSVTEVRT